MSRKLKSCVEKVTNASLEHKKIRWLDISYFGLKYYFPHKKSTSFSLLLQNRNNKIFRTSVHPLSQSIWGPIFHEMEIFKNWQSFKKEYQIWSFLAVANIWMLEFIKTDKCCAGKNCNFGLRPCQFLPHARPYFYSIRVLYKIFSTFDLHLLVRYCKRESDLKTLIQRRSQQVYLLNR